MYFQLFTFITLDLINFPLFTFYFEIYIVPRIYTQMWGRNIRFTDPGSYKTKEGIGAKSFLKKVDKKFCVYYI